MFAQDLLDIVDLARKPASGTLAVVQSDAGEHARRQFQYAAMTSQDYVEYLLRRALDDGVHGAELVGQTGAVHDGQGLGDHLLDALSGAHGNYGKAGKHDCLLRVL